MTGLVQEVRYVVRQLRRKPGFTFTAALTLALGIGANVAIFTIVNGLILRPLPVPEAKQIMVLATQQQDAPLGVYYFSYPDLVDFRKQADTFSDLFAYGVGLEGLSADNKADHFLVSYVTGNYFSALGLKPALGRLLLPGEGEKPGSEPLIVISYAYWQKRFGGDGSVIGKQVLVDGKPATIVGVGPQEFHGAAFALDMDGFLPLSMAAADDPELWANRSDRQWITLGRLKPGVSLAQAQSTATVIAARLAEQYPASNKGIAVNIVPEPLSHPVPLPGNLIEIIAGIFLVLAALILILAGVNVANILLVRATAREGEMAIRAALGASRSRLMFQVLVESILLSLLGAAGGMAFGSLASRWVTSLRITSIIPIHLDFGLDWHVFVYGFTAAVLTGAVIGLWPAFRVARPNLSDTLREAGRSGASGAGRQRVRSILVGVQVAGSLMLLIVGGLFLRSLQNVQRTYLGFETDHMLNVVLDPHQVGYDQVRATNFYRDLEERVRALPGVQSASLAYSVPMGNYSNIATVTIEGHPTPAGQRPPTLLFNQADSAYFQTMRIPLLRGRAFTDADNENAPKVAVINQTMAERFWPQEDAIGKRFTTDETKGTWWQVVGITQNGKYGQVFEDPKPYFYLPLAQNYVSMRALQIRTAIDPAALMVPVQQEIKKLDPGLPLFSIRTMTDSLDGANGFMIFKVGALLASSIGLMGLTLAVVGVYGVVAFAASQRIREIGIRMALGASRVQVMKLVLRQGVWVVLVGALAGVLVAFGASRVIANLLVGVSATDPLTFGAATALLVAVALCACYVPAYRAMKLDPMVALRYE